MRQREHQLRFGWLIYALVFFAGLAALSWEVLWQLQSSLALGISARGTAIALAGTMSGMTLGSLSAGSLLRRSTSKGALVRPLFIYGLVEVSIGLFGQALLPGFRWIESLDANIYASSPALAPLVQVAAIVLLIWPPALAMGATFPLFGLIAERTGTSVARLYGFNTAGAAIGTLTLAFLFVPALGISISVGLLSSLNVLLGLAAIVASRSSPSIALASDDDASPASSSTDEKIPGATIFALATGFATFAFEVIWFRALRASFGSTTESFAIMLAAVLIPIAIAGYLAPHLVRRNIGPGSILTIAAALLLLSTPLIERFDHLPFGGKEAAWLISFKRFGVSLLVLSAPVLALSLVFPMLLERRRTASGLARLYAWNTAGALAGSLATAWLILPAIGLVPSAWIIAAALALLGVLYARKISLAAAAAAALAIAVLTQSGVGGLRIIAQFAGNAPYRLVAVREGPDSTVAVTELVTGTRALYIDGFEATSEGGTGAYMRWMGSLPMLLHDAPQRALVICFGTGQTADGVRQENPQALDVVDINEAVFEMAPLFTSNQNVLDDPRVQSIVMDGRAWLRRTDRIYDVITLEPMPPNFAGVNALYSREFYELAAQRLSPRGVVAQWLPIHLVDVHDAVSIAATFRAVFPDSILWFDPSAKTGILLGRRETEGGSPLGTEWPGLTRKPEGRSLDRESILRAVALDVERFGKYAALGSVITDDNQQLAYGWGHLLKGDVAELFFSNIRLLKDARHGGLDP